jgi:hypothetical protein
LPAAPLLVIDNASPQEDLRRRLATIAAADPSMELVLRTENESANGKVGGLYHAYRIAFDRAASWGVGFVHLMQADMQLLWWDEDTMKCARSLFNRHPNCANLYTTALSRDHWLGDGIAADPRTGDTVLTRYGLTDTGLFDLERWRRFGLEFENVEEAHGTLALQAGMQVVVFPSPTEVQVPWPCVTRGGRQRGREIRTRKEFLCRPLTAQEVRSLKAATSPVAIEGVCVPWGWYCLSPMWVTDLDNPYYFALRRRDAALNGWRHAFPRWVTAGLDRRIEVLYASHRPSLVALLSRQILAYVKLRLREHLT